MRRFCILLALSFCANPFAEQPPPSSKTVSDSIKLIWESVAHDFTALADAMPEDKWNFKPTQGKFDNVRTFGEQVKHVACANEAWAKKIKGEKKLPDRCDLGGPNPARTKAEIVAYLRESTRMMDDAIASTNANNLQQPLPGPYFGDTRLACLNAALWHISDHYGQLVVYLRLNGLVPPASQ
jgi:uncharacterized damage-inducible protein DinB